MKKKKKSKVLEQFRKDSLKTKTVSLLINLEIRNVQCNKMALCDFFFFWKLRKTIRFESIDDATWGQVTVKKVSFLCYYHFL